MPRAPKPETSLEAWRKDDFQVTLGQTRRVLVEVIATRLRLDSVRGDSEEKCAIRGYHPRGQISVRPAVARQ